MRQHRPVPERVTARVAYDPGIRETVQNYGDALEETNFNEVNARHARGEYDGECECTRNLLRYANNARTHSHVMSIEPAEYATDPRILSAQDPAVSCRAGAPFACGIGCLGSGTGVPVVPLCT